MKMILRFKYMLENAPIFGVGFAKLGQNVNSDNPTAVSFHNFVGDISVVFGSSGFIAFGMLFLSIAINSSKLLRIELAAMDRSIIIGVIGFNFQMLVLSLSANDFFLLWGIVPLTYSWGIIDYYFIKYIGFNRKKQKKVINKYFCAKEYPLASD